MTTQTEELIKEIAIKHGVTFGQNDPILILQTINNRLMQDSAKSQQEILNQYKEEMAETALKWESDAKEKAERILNAALNSSKEVMAKLLQESASAMATSARKEIESSLEKVSAKVNEVKRMSALNVFSATITLVAAGMVIWATFPH